MNTKQVLLDIAKQDLEAARSLHEKKLYPQAVFYLEQAVEKAAKSMGLYQNVISEDELKDIGHESIEIYVRVVEGLKNKVIRFQDRIKQFPKLKNTTLIKEYEVVGPDKLNEMISNFEIYLKHPRRQMSDVELEKTLSELSKLETEIENQKITQDELEGYKVFFREVAGAMVEEHPDLREAVEKESKKVDSLTVESMGELITSIGIPQAVCNYSLIFLSAFFGPHASFSRYPYPEHEHNPLMVYTTEHPLVKRFDQLAQTTERVLNRMSGLFSQDVSEKLKLWGEPVGG